MSTPIETNTEELREILDEVYNLPDRSTGGSSEPDLVIGANANGELSADNQWFNFLNDNLLVESFVILGGDVSRVIEKVKNGIAPRVQLREMQVYNSGYFSRGICDAVYVSIGNKYGTSYYDGEEYDRVIVKFSLLDIPGYNGGNNPCDLSLEIDSTGVRSWWAHRYNVEREHSGNNYE